MNEVLSYFAQNRLYLTAKDILELVSYIATLLAVITIFIGVKQLKMMQNDTNDRDSRLQIENSIEVLKTFSSKIIPSCENLERSLSDSDKRIFKNFTYVANNNFYFEKKDMKDKHLLAEVQLKSDKGLVEIFNQMELMCVYIEKDLVEADMVYSIISDAFLGFIDRHVAVLSYYRTEYAPYKNVINTYKKWNGMREKEKMIKEEKVKQIENQQARLEKEKAEIVQN